MALEVLSHCCLRLTLANFSNVQHGSSSISPSQVGLLVSYALNVTSVLTYLVRASSDVETNIVAVERLKEYSEIPQEAPWELVDSTEEEQSEHWPETGMIHFEDYAMRYRDGLDLVLRGVRLRINGSEKVGIIGRTGAGKSSLSVALFRLVEAAGSGRITIDGRDISELGLHYLRSRITVIPQDPFIFSGTLRTNLDPLDAHTDDEVWGAIKRAHLLDFVAGLGKSHTQKAQ